MAELRGLRRHPADGAKFYLALLDAAPDLFLLANEVEDLTAMIRNLVSVLEAVAAEVTEREGGGKPDGALRILADSISDPDVRKVVGS